MIVVRNTALRYSVRTVLWQSGNDRLARLASVKRKIPNSLAWSAVFLLIFIGSLYLAWLSLAKVNFLYPLGYNLIEIDKTIVRYAPVNLYKKNFQLTDRDQHIRLFEKIVTAVLNQGAGLENIYYYHPDGRVIDTFLTRAEIIHLNDVAALVSFVDVVGVAVLLAAVLLVFILLRIKLKFPSLYKYHLISVLGLPGLALLVFSIGAEKLFYRAHGLIFPDNHQWFFYYQESLMTTLMKAPDLFAIIAVQLLLLSLVYYSLGLFCLRRLVGVAR